jgi:nitrogen-specific signal transduction histidine kinase
VTQPETAEPLLPPPPHEAMIERMLEHAHAIEAAGKPEHAAALRSSLEGWRRAQQDWIERLARALAVHHEINNALVGVRGNAQLLLMGPAGKQPGVRERLEVVIRESKRIQEAAGRIREIKAAIGGADPASRAA